ncbi:MAG: hypothetical protein M1818_002095 [Claussenomyces sp. TS43310]|nr:MAG: hypothetical protein M1818_002095 [Claussenomyces sp. TS43310]
MAVITRLMVDVFDVIGRAAPLQQRDGSGSSTAPSSVAAPTSTASTASASPTSTSSNGGGGGGQSPLLFFVALGFGVVFTNLWIIVGVKYCFRYNARNRALARGENTENVPLENVTQGRPHRRRREKKLMTMDEVNERFPMMKYKNWVAARAGEGLPTAGGVTAPTNHLPVSQDDEAVASSSPIDTTHTVDDRSTAGTSFDEPADCAPIIAADSSRRSIESQKSAKISQEETKSDYHVTEEEETKTSMPTLQEAPTVATLDDPKASSTAEIESDDEEDDHIHDALPVELLDRPGDSCAICIDTLEQDDDIRGLTCGHAFHAGCLDPWLTSRRACCPLCKADYYVPKPKPEGEVPTPEPRERGGRRAGRRVGRAGVGAPPQTYAGWRGIRGHGRLVLLGLTPNSNASNYGPDGHAYPPGSRESRVINQRRSVEAQAAAAARNQRGFAGRTATANPFSGIRMPRFGLPSRRAINIAAANRPTTQTVDPTPAQLEAGAVS